MEVLYPRCAGLDVHKKLIVACVRLIDGGRIVRKKERFGTTTADLMRMAAWMTEHNVTHAAMQASESDGTTQPRSATPAAIR